MYVIFFFFLLGQLTGQMNGNRQNKWVYVLTPLKSSHVRHGGAFMLNALVFTQSRGRRADGQLHKGVSGVDSKMAV